MNLFRMKHNSRLADTGADQLLEPKSESFLQYPGINVAVGATLRHCASYRT